MTVRLKTWEELGQIDGYKLDEANDRIVSYNDNYQLTHKRYDLVKEQALFAYLYTRSSLNEAAIKISVDSANAVLIPWSFIAEVLVE